MCILFLYVDNNPAPSGYQLIAAVNRDEFFHRPTKSACLWEGHCISGVDMEPGREGGTWFGTSTNSKIGALLNILAPSSSREKQGRGHIITNYLTGNEDAEKYIKQIMSNRDDYNAFNLVLIEKRDGKWSVNYCNSEQENSARQLSPGILVFGNSSYEKPWQKVVHGKEKFQEIVASYNSTLKEAELKEEILGLLTDKTSYFPDPQLQSQSSGFYSSPEIVSARSAVFVDLNKLHYGTRTHTLLLIDDLGRCEYTEKTMSYPTDTAEPTWKTVTHTYQLNPVVIGD